ncbi:NAD(P)/FAD-dependent oxidoreductase [Arthrobacter sp. MYb224]|uniref:flavin-containing monooxygenase n=1 Tax=Arthrobacter sp. MYb224 TaxID=1848600 RepID=UPI00215818CA|nr:NAD(P)/FAD-dependent oxidoreductase [Arthrobacter sp. MYb224]
MHHVAGAAGMRTAPGLLYPVSATWRKQVRVSYQSIVIGAGQAGLSAAYQLHRRGLVPGEDFLVLDANERPGGAWQHRWDTLTLGKTHRIHPLPDFPFENQDPTRPASAVVSDYYAQFEALHRLAVRRPAKVAAVSHDGTWFSVRLSSGEELATRTLINASGTWTNPFWPVYPGSQEFTGPQVHTSGFVAPEQFAGQRVLVVGGGASATQFIVQLRSAGIDTLWSTRRAPDWREVGHDPEWGVAVEREVNARTAAGLPPKSVVGTTGLILTEAMRAGIDSGALISRGAISSLGARSVRFADGTSEKIDAILWATGFRHAHRHLRGLKLHTSAGGIRVLADSVSAAALPGMFFVGYGASASTIGATRAGRKAAVAAVRRLAELGVAAGSADASEAGAENRPPQMTTAR